MIGMFTAAQNRERLDAIERKLHGRVDADERSELEADKRELQAWFRDLERLEG